jgi:hypothetical protein
VSCSTLKPPRLLRSLDQEEEEKEGWREGERSLTIKQCLEVGKYYALSGNTEKEGEETPLLVTLHHQSDSREVGGRSE